MRSLVLIALMSAIVAPGFAQTPAPTPAPPPPPVSAPTPTPGAGAARPPNASRDACRTEIDAKSLTGPERQEAMRTCMRGRVEACRKEAATQGVPARSAERREFVQRCMRQHS